MSTPASSTPASHYRQHLAALTERAQAALERGGFEHLVIPSGTLHYQLFDDRDYPYAVNPQFKHWLPLTRTPGSWLVMTPGCAPRLIYLQPRDYWHVVPETPSGYWMEHFNIHIIRTPEEALHYLPPDPARCAILGEAASALGAYVPNNPPPVLAYLDWQRAFKTPYELAMLREATRLGVRAHRAAEQAFRAGASEFEIHLAYCRAAGQESSELPYGNIIALNRHGAVLHYTEFDRTPPAPAYSLLIDAGASHGGYASDITRTYAAETGSEFQALIDAVDAVQRGAIGAQFRAGVDYRDIHLNAHRALAGVLREFGLITVSAEAAVESAISRAFFPHGIGHGIGLQVHDVGGFAESDRGGIIPKPEGHPALRLTRTLQPGMVVTNEPGLYFIDMLLDELKAGPHADAVNWARVAEFHRYGGIRIEDNLVITEDAPINLTRDAFAALQN